MYTQDAGAPQLPMEFLEDMTYYYNAAEQSRYIDINAIVYNRLEAYSLYSFMKGLAGAYLNSYVNAENIPFNVCTFEAMGNAELLMALIESETYAEQLQKLCSILGYDYLEANSAIKEYDKAFEVISDMIVEENDNIIMNMSSVASVFMGMWLCSKIKRKNPKVVITGIGNQINVPYVARLAAKLGLIDTVEQPSFCCEKRITRLGLFKALELKEIIKQYPLYYGIRIVPYQISFGCSSKCNFCTERMLWDKTGKVKDCLEIFDYDTCKSEIEYLVDECNVGGLTFNDCTFDLRIPIFNRIGELIKEKDLFFSASSRIDLIDDDYIKNLREMNCTALLIGLETLNRKSVQIFNKGDDLYGKTAVETVKKLYENNIVTQVNIVLFHPNESYEDVKESILKVHEFVERVRRIGVIVPKLSVGEMVINYPSKNYMDVISNKDVIVEYHANEKLREIPIRVRYPNKESKQSKNSLICSVMKDVEPADSVALHIAALLSGHWKLFYKKWSSNNIIISIREKEEKEKVLNALKEYKADISDEKILMINKLTLNENETKEFVTKVLLFNILDLIELKGHK
jgi:radical SAM superfamily